MRDGYLWRIEDNAPCFVVNSILRLLEDKPPYRIISEGERL